MGVPVETETLGLVANKLDLSIDLAKRGRLERVFRSVKDQNLAINAEGSNDVGVLGLKASLVHLSRMLDLLDNVTLDGGNIARLSVATNLATLIVIVAGVRCHSLGNLDIGNLDEVGALIRSVSAEQKAVHSVVLALRFLDVGKPLNCQGWPGEGSSIEMVILDGG